MSDPARLRPEDVLETLPLDTWHGPFAPELRERAIRALEAGKVLFLPGLGFPVAPEEAGFLTGTAAEALRQLSPRFGHIRRSRTGVLDAFFLLYAREGEGRKPFLDWVREDYDEDALRHAFRANGLASFVNDWVLAHE
ncbi:MAG: hypothetical protein JOY66_00380 [Acetobacteraceae bacterium]|nr:hypothetical protein [Acetobacteraceae bacterium]